MPHYVIDDAFNVTVMEWRRENLEIGIRAIRSIRRCSSRKFNNSIGDGDFWQKKLETAAP